MKINIVNCARCGLRHNDMEVSEFTRPININDEFRYRYYSTCPNTGQVILVEIIFTPVDKSQV